MVGGGGGGGGDVGSCFQLLSARRIGFVRGMGECEAQWLFEAIGQRRIENMNAQLEAGFKSRWKLVIEAVMS